MPYMIYIASVLGAAALLMMMPRARYTPSKLGGLLGAAALGSFWLFTSKTLLPAAESAGIAQPVIIYYYIFSAIALFAAVRVITHTKPIYAALWFVMVVLAVSGLLLILSAEFMAMAMIMIYGGAILVTYMFVIMLASHAGDPPPPPDTPDTPDTPEVAPPPEAASEVALEISPQTNADSQAGPLYDRVAREPAGAVLVGFCLLAVLLQVMYDPDRLPNGYAAGPTDKAIIDTLLTNRTAARQLENIQDPQQKALLAEQYIDAQHLDNSERVGMNLFHQNPLGIELAGVILLISLVGAVVIAKLRVENQIAEQ